MKKAWLEAATNVFMLTLGYVSIVVAPWYLLPIAWIFTGTALTGSFVIGHDCGHRSFAKKRWVNDLVGHLFMLPLIYPFHCWRILHDHHHSHTNKMNMDNAWQPLRPEFYDSVIKPGQWGYQLLRGWFWWVASIVHWAALHFHVAEFDKKDHNKVKLSIAVVLGFAVIFFPVLIATTGIWGLVKFWLMPWLVYHFWMSTFTLVHHTLPEIQFQEPENWDVATAQLSGTVHCEYPFWVEFLCFHINVHIPHHLSPAIPAYHLRQAHESLLKEWGSVMKERRFSLALMKTITQECHLYHPERAYQSFKVFHQSEE